MKQVQPAQYELTKIILDFIGTIIWPVTAFAIILIYRESILKLINRAKKVELPGGVSLETLDREIEHAKELAEEIKDERKPEIQKYIDGGRARVDSEANKKMVELGLNPSPSGLDLGYYKNIADTDPSLALLGLRLDFELMLRNLAKGFSISVGGKEPLSRLIAKLFDGGAITTRQYEFINTVFRISNSAAHGAPVSKGQAYQVLDIGQVLVDDYVAWLDWGFRSK